MCFEFNKGVKATLHYFNVKWNVHPEITLCISKEYVSNTCNILIIWEAAM